MKQALVLALTCALAGPLLADGITPWTSAPDTRELAADEKSLWREADEFDEEAVTRHLARNLPEAPFPPDQPAHQHSHQGGCPGLHAGASTRSGSARGGGSDA